MRSDTRFLKELQQKKLGILRRISQVITLVALLSLPLLGLLVLDLTYGSLLFFGRPVWTHEISLIVLGLGVVMIGLAMLAIFTGRAFCGWACPQTLLCELTSWSSKDKQGDKLNLAGLLAKFIVVTAIGLSTGLVVLTFVLGSWPVGRLFSYPIDTSILKGLAIVAILVAVDIGILRHSFCEWICLVGWWQRLFKSPASLKIAFSSERGKECDNCQACHASCFMGIDPRRRDLPQYCLNCSRCVEACGVHLAENGTTGLIHFVLPLQKSRTKSRFAVLAPKIGALVVLMGAVLVPFVLSLGNRDAIQLTVRQTEPVYVSQNGMLEGRFLVDIYNNGRIPASLLLRQDGLPAENTSFSPKSIVVEPRGRYEATMRFRVEPGQMEPGLHLTRIIAEASGGDLAQVFSATLKFGVPPMASNSQGSQTGAQRGPVEHLKVESLN